MMTIRPAQFTALAASRLSEFESRMVGHLQTCFPGWSRELGEEKLEEFVRRGIGRAKLHGFRVELDLAYYLHVMQALGETFDEAPEHAWARELLASELSPPEKMDRLREAASYSKEARGIRDACRRRYSSR